MEPFTADCLCRGVGSVPVTGHDVVALDDDLARLVVVAFGPVGPHHLHLGVEVALARGARLADGHIGGCHAGGSACLGESVDLVDLDSHLHVLVDQRDRHGGGTAEEPPHRRLVVHGGVKRDPHGLQHGGNQKCIVDLLLGDQFPCLRGVERPHQDLGKTAVRGDDGRCERAHVEQRHRVQVAVTDGEVTADVQGGEGRELGVMGVHDALRQSGGA